MWTYVIGYLINGIIFGLITQYVANSKGYDGGFWWGFFLGLIGLLVVGFRPSIEQPASPSYTESRYSQEERERNILDNGGWKCDCGKVNFDYVSTCHCGRNKREVLAKRYEAEEQAKHSIEIKPIEDKTAAQQIKEFKELYDEGIISSEEFEAKKKQLLGL